VAFASTSRTGPPKEILPFLPRSGEALRRGGLQVAVSTGGASPTLARRIRGELEEVFGPEWAGVVEELESVRRSGEMPDAELEGEVSRCLSQLRG
jgi:precorrin-2 dehydrogenase/sirohydrochlorin ferrochelatase